MTLPETVVPRPNWWQRNWKWFVPTGCLVLLALCAAFVFSLVVFVFSVIRHTDVFKDALEKAKANPQVQAELGEPIREGWWLTGEVRTVGPTGNADIAIPLKGSRKNGTLYAVAQKSAGKWTYDRLEVEVEGRAERIDLLKVTRGDVE
jgi:cytochrome oxidase complex assembly protein 1